MGKIFLYLLLYFKDILRKRIKNLIWYKDVSLKQYVNYNKGVSSGRSADSQQE